jgi:hypothetical protein
MGCVVSSSTKVSNVPSKERYQRREGIRQAQLEKQSIPDALLNTSKITSTVYRVHPDTTPIIKEKKKRLLYLADKGTFLSPPTSPTMLNNNKRSRNNGINIVYHVSAAADDGNKTPTSPPLIFKPSAPFSVTKRLQQLYKKLRYQLDPTSDDEITHDEERHDAMMLYGHHSGTKCLDSCIKLLNGNEDNLFLHKVIWQDICSSINDWVSVETDLFAIIDTIVAAFFGNDAAFFAFTSTQSCAVYLLFLCISKATSTTFFENNAHEQNSDGKNDEGRHQQQQARIIENCYKYLDSNETMNRKSGLSIIRTLLHTYIVNRYVFNIHYISLYRGTKYSTTERTLPIKVTSESELLKCIYDWAMRWLANDKQNLDTTKILFIPPSPTNKDDLSRNNNNSTLQREEANCVGNNIIENNALETYQKHIHASQALYNRLRADIKQRKASIDDDFVEDDVNSSGSMDMNKSGPEYVIDYEIVRVLEFNRSDPHIFMQLYTHWRKEKYSPEHLVDMNALTCVLGVLQRANPENIIYGSIMIAATLCLLYTMEGTNAFDRLILNETRRLEKQTRSNKHTKLKVDVENYAHGISKVSIANTNNSIDSRALQTLANAGSTIHDAYIWADSNFELFPSTHVKHGGNQVKSIFSDGLPQVFFED